MITETRNKHGYLEHNHHPYLHWHPVSRKHHYEHPTYTMSKKEAIEWNIVHRPGYTSEHTVTQCDICGYPYTSECEFDVHRCDGTCEKRQAEEE